MPTVVRSHAKINLGLGIGAPRQDGFHGLTTLYQTLELHDLVTVTAKRASATRLEITATDGRVPRDETNTAWKMVGLALETLGLDAEVAIHIDKRLPVQGGLGAGSANAVAALVGLEAELGLSRKDSAPPPDPASPRLRGQARLALAAAVGSDVPLFLIGGTVLGVDRGQEVYPLPDLDPVWCLVAAPSIGVSTARAFADWDRLCLSGGLTPEASADKLKELSRAYASAFSGWPRNGSSGVLSSRKDLAGPAGAALVRTGITSWIQNDFEQVVFPQQPILCEIKRLLAASAHPEEVLHASLSGSGSALFGLYRTREGAEAARSRIEGAVRQVEVRCTVTRTLPRDDYWGRMLIEEVC